MGSRAGMGVLRAGKKGGSKGVVARAVREGRPRPFFIHSPPGCRGEGAMPRYCREPTWPSGRTGKCTCQDFPRASSTARCPSSWETRGRRGAGAGRRGSTRASGEDATAWLGPRRRLRQQREGRGSDFRFGCEDRSSGCHAARACPVSWAAAQQPPGPRRRQCPPFLNQTPSTRGRCWSHRRRATVMGGYF